MIFVTVGSMFPFDRLARAADEWARSRSVRDIFVQIGDGRYIPTGVDWARSLPPGEFTSRVRDCDLLVAHLGMGSILTAMQAGKRMVLLPRIQALGEHTTDHQLHGAKWIRGKPGIRVVDDVSALHEALDDFLKGAMRAAPEDLSPHASAELIDNVKRFIAS